MIASSGHTMNSFKKVFKLHSKDGHKGHEKMKDKKTQEMDAIRQGIDFYVDYIGSTLVEELDEGQSYGDKISSKAVKAIHDMAKAGHRKCHKVGINVSVDGIRVTDTEEDILLTNLSIYRIHFCTADKHHDHIFAYIARSTENETMECHAFQCSKRKTAQNIALTVAQSFQLAKEDFDTKEKERDVKKLNADFPPTESSHNNHQGQNSQNHEEKPLIHNTTTTSEDKSTILGFEDNFADVQFPNRNPSIGENKNVNPFRNSTFNVGVEVEELNDSLLQWLSSQEAQQRLVNSHTDLIEF